MNSGEIRRELLLQSMLLRYPLRQPDNSPRPEACKPAAKTGTAVPAEAPPPLWPEAGHA